LTNGPHSAQTADSDSARAYATTMPAKVKTRILFHSRRLNIYLVRYPEGHKVGPHVDMVSEGRLYKLNWVLAKPKAGGEFICDKNIFNLFGRLYLFRPDLYQHRVSKIERGNRWLLSFALTSGLHNSSRTVS
jgi:2-oxoglutarate-Fe(II)-dependent oxygenase superfamily protein